MSEDWYTVGEKLRFKHGDNPESVCTVVAVGCEGGAAGNHLGGPLDGTPVAHFRVRWENGFNSAGHTTRFSVRS